MDLTELKQWMAERFDRLEAMHKAKPALPRRYYTVPEVCDLLRIGRTMLDAMAKAGKLRKIKRGGKVLFLAVQIDGMIAKEERTA